MKKIKIQLKNPKDVESLILMVYRFSGKKLVMSLHEKVLVKYWNFEKMRVRANSNYPDHNRLNYTIDNWITALTKAITDYERRDSIPSILELKAKVREIKNPDTNLDSSVSDKILVELRKYIESIEASKRLSIGMIQSFNQLNNNLKSFSESRSLTFQDFDLNRLIAFTAHLNRSTKDKEQYKQSTVVKLQRRLVKFLKDMDELGANVDVKSLNSKKWRLKQSKVSGNNLAFTKNEISLIANVQLDKKLDAIRDRFLIGIYTGQRYSDFKALNTKDVIVENRIEILQIRQKKTKIKVSIPLTDKIKAIFNKYNGTPPEYSEPVFNKQIKEICDLANITDLMKVEHEHNNKITSTMERKCDVVSSHTCRRTFVTIGVQSGLPLNEIMKVSGHTNLVSLSRYLKGNLGVGVDAKDIYNKLFD